MFDDIEMTINGVACAGEGTVPVINPATGAPFAEAPSCSRAQLDAAMTSAQAVQPDWSRDESRRREALRQAAAAMFAGAEQMAPVLTAEQGKPLGDAATEFLGAGAWFQYFADLELPDEVLQDDEVARVRILRRPMGVVAAITPWNFPIILAATKLGPALLAGNTVVLKPSPYTPLSSLKLGEVLRDVLPPGVLNVVSGGDEVGQWMTEHPIPRKVAFTGSVATGKSVARSAATDLKRTTLELGGNDPAIVLDDADVDAIVGPLFGAAFVNCGQVCAAIKRVYVHEDLYDSVVEGLTAAASAVVVGDGTDPSTTMGPINNEAQLERVSGLVADALAGGGRATAGGAALDGPGYFFAPTIVAGVSDGARLVDEEQFGPALPVISFREVDEVVGRANATQFGLGGSVWGVDADRAASVARRLDCGTAWVNSHLAGGPQVPFGGLKWSGIGVENGPWGYHSFTDLQVLHEARSGPPSEG